MIRPRGNPGKSRQACRVEQLAQGEGRPRSSRSTMLFIRNFARPFPCPVKAVRDQI